MNQARYLLLVVIFSLPCIQASASDVPDEHRARHHAHHADVPPVPPEQYQPAPDLWSILFPRNSEPARMIEVRPGYIISTYDCITDEGRGRYLPCDMGGSQ